MKVLLIGANGKMGKVMQQVLTEHGHSFVAIDIDNRHLIESCKADVMLDFSSKDCLIENLHCAINKQIPIVIATTNHDEKNLHEIEIAKTKIPIFMSANFSLLFNVFVKILKNFKGLKDCEFLVEETHHKTKKDMPSGSCKTLLDELNKMNITPQVNCFRVGNIVGEHKIKIVHNNEILEIKHTVLSKVEFCEGALRACEFILTKNNGLFDMNDLTNQL